MNSQCHETLVTAVTTVFDYITDPMFPGRCFGAVYPRGWTENKVVPDSLLVSHYINVETNYFVANWFLTTLGHIHFVQ